MNKNEKTKGDIKIDAGICKLIDYELKRYKSKGFGLIFAWIAAISFFLFLPNLLKYYWPDNIKNPGLFYALTVYVFFNLTMILTNLEYLVYYSIEHSFFEKYKTTPDPWPWKQNKEKWNAQIKKAIKTVCFNTFVLLPLFLIPNVIANESPYRLDRESMPDVFELLSQLVICMLCEDFFFYLSHRLLHNDYFYNKIHKIHHEFNETVTISALYSHPLEFIIGNIIPSSIAPMILGQRMHLLTHLVYIVMVLHESNDGHSGYTFSWSPHRVIPLTFDADFHIFHHWKFRGNYANYFSIWDKFFGTVNKTFIEYFNNKDQYIKKYREMNAHSNDTKED
jgi:sterol desaturase/sphingolipid hydroxylase (fatty acid hydroxylase superfamily)